MKFCCPNCGQPFDGLAVQEVECPTCHRTFNPRPPQQRVSPAELDHVAIVEQACGQCGATFQMPDLPTSLRSSIAELVRSAPPTEKWPFEAIDFLRSLGVIGLLHCKQVAEHITRSKGVCHSCDAELPASDEVVCENCRALNLDW